MEEVTAAGEDSISALKSKHAAALVESQDETEAVKKAKAKSDKDKAAVAAELSDATAEISALKKQKQGGEKTIRTLEDQILELRGNLEEQEAALADSAAKNAKLASEGKDCLVLFECTPM